MASEGNLKGGGVLLLSEMLRIKNVYAKKKVMVITYFYIEVSSPTPSRRLC